ncbi:hypothetical protein HMPREF3231_01246 [Bifidobacterium longum]|nr:hypothetical protein HMPREF3231_01246 [Bifidobacterium longum]
MCYLHGQQVTKIRQSQEKAKPPRVPPVFQRLSGAAVHITRGDRIQQPSDGHGQHKQRVEPSDGHIARPWPWKSGTHDDNRSAGRRGQGLDRRPCRSEVPELRRRAVLQPGRGIPEPDSRRGRRLPGARCGVIPPESWLRSASRRTSRISNVPNPSD